MGYTTLDFDRKKFRKYNGEVIDDITLYIKNSIENGEDIRVVVGCDSQQRRTYTIYALTIILYDEIKHKGANVVYMKIRTPKQRDIFTRLMNESMYSLDLANWLDEHLEGIYNKPKFDHNDYDDSIPTRKIEIHVDLNPEYGVDKRNKSHVVYSSVMGMLCGSGFCVKSKPVSYAASSAADSLLRNK